MRIPNILILFTLTIDISATPKHILINLSAHKNNAILKINLVFSLINGVSLLTKFLNNF